MYHTVRSFRKTKPIFTMDFWNDGEFVDGCIAGGRCYLHINANGDIEPCAFIPVFDSFRIEKPTKHIATKCIGGFCFLNFFAYFFLCFCEFKNFFHIFFRHDLIVGMKSECLV